MFILAALLAWVEWIINPRFCLNNISRFDFETGFFLFEHCVLNIDY